MAEDNSNARFERIEATLERITERLDRIAAREEAADRRLDRLLERDNTLDRRLDRLTERHEALAQSVELFIHESRANSARLTDALTRLVSIVESH